MSTQFEILIRLGSLALKLFYLLRMRWQGTRGPRSGEIPETPENQTRAPKTAV